MFRNEKKPRDAQIDSAFTDAQIQCAKFEFFFEFEKKTEIFFF